MDSRDKRASAVNVSMPWRGLYPEPGTLDADDRPQIAFLYRMSAGEPPADDATNLPTLFHANVGRMMNRR